MLVKKRGQPFHSHCRKGHELTHENTILHSQGKGKGLHRQCRICRNATTRARKAKMRDPKKVTQLEIRERKTLARLIEKYRTNIAIEETPTNRALAPEIEEMK